MGLEKFDKGDNKRGGNSSHEEDCECPFCSDRDNGTDSHSDDCPCARCTSVGEAVQGKWEDGTDV